VGVHGDGVQQWLIGFCDSHDELDDDDDDDDEDDDDVPVRHHWPAGMTC